ncbi:MAG TPA: class I SAM-dependent methyltransferase [Steroidobacteraceae bacterium]|nr:class I SAM-dependent methyltransferase [Steroidobacteraceae bacterium]
MNHWDERYGVEEYYYGVEPNDFLREQSGMLPRGREVLCLGEGEGRNAVFLAALGFTVTAVDQSPVGLGKARALAGSRGVRIDTVVADLANWALGSSRWGGIVSIWCHLPRTLRARVHREVATALEPGGVFILEAYTPAQLKFRTGGPTDPALMPTLEDLREELAGLELVVGHECERVIHEGRGHDGLSATVQVVARRTAR